MTHFTDNYFTIQNCIEIIPCVAHHSAHWTKCTLNVSKLWKSTKVNHTRKHFRLKSSENLAPNPLSPCPPWGTRVGWNPATTVTWKCLSNPPLSRWSRFTWRRSPSYVHSWIPNEDGYAYERFTISESMSLKLEVTYRAYRAIYDRASQLQTFMYLV